jgi:hypothetical protein
MMSNLPICDACGYQWNGDELHFCPAVNTDKYTNSLLKQVLASLERIENKLSKDENESKESKTS